MFVCDFKVISCRSLPGKDGKSYVKLVTEDLDNVENRYNDFGDMFRGLIGVPAGTLIRCQMYHTVDYKTGGRVSRINDYEILMKEEVEYV